MTEIPDEFECRRCGYCCKKYGPELSFTQEDMDFWDDCGLDWVHYYPFIDWDLQEFVSPDNGIFFVENIEDAKRVLEEAELEYEKDTGVRPSFPWGGTLSYCPFLKWSGNKWACLIHKYKSETCRTYLCYWDRLEAAFNWLYS